MLNLGYYDEHQLRDYGIKRVGSNVRIAKTCTVIGVANLEIGSDVRIDGYCSLLANDRGFIRIGNKVHISGYSSLLGGDGIEIADFCNISQGVRLFSRADDYSGETMTNPMVPAELTGVTRGLVKLERHVIIGAGSIVLPHAVVAEGCAIGALSLVNRSTEAWGIYAGCPAKRVKERSRKLLELEASIAPAGKPPAV